ncbi:helix-turn-helix transcriptional regulator [Pseudomonas aeruginosa]
MLLTIDDLQAQLRISRAKIYRMISRGEFPAPQKLGRCSRWRKTDIENYLSSLQ